MSRQRLLGKLKGLYYPLVAIAVSLIIGGVFIALLGFDAVTAYKGLLKGAAGNPGAFCESMNKAVPIILTGISFAIANSCGMVNLGAEGQLHIGAMCAVFAGVYVQLPPAMHPLFMVFAGALGGALWGMIVGALKNRFNANELIVTIMLNYIATSLVEYFISGPFRGQSTQGNFPQSAMICESARIQKLFSGVRLHAGVIYVLIALVVYYLFLKKSKLGYEIRVVGMNPTAADYAGISIRKSRLIAMAVAGAFAGIAGAIELGAVQYRILEGFSSNFGYDGIAVALLGNGTSVGILLSGILLGMLKAGANKMQVLTSVPSSTLRVIQGVLIIMVVGRKLFEFGGRGQGQKRRGANNALDSKGVK